MQKPTYDLIEWFRGGPLPSDERIGADLIMTLAFDPPESYQSRYHFANTSLAANKPFRAAGKPA
jgi:hypothetical protein